MQELEKINAKFIYLLKNNKLKEVDKLISNLENTNFFEMSSFLPSLKRKREFCCF
nr:hypothetical protein [Candidatus Gracilibacteria bacterium]